MENTDLHTGNNKLALLYPVLCGLCSPASHLMLVVVVPLLQEGALLGMHLGTDRGPATLRLLRDAYLGRERTAEALHINPRARISRHRRKTLEEGRVDGGGDTWVEAVVRVRVGHLVNSVSM